MEPKISLFQAPASLPSAVRAVLEEEIIFGRLEPGERLTEVELAEKYKVSRSPIREALFQLEKDHLLVREPRRGFRVAPVSGKELDDIYTCRLALEGVAAQEAARRRTVEDSRQLNESLRGLHAAVIDRNIDEYFRWNVALTNHIHAMADNDVLNSLLDGIGKSALRYRYLVYKRRQDKLDQSLSGNRNIVAAIEEGDSARARSLTEGLIRESWSAIRAILQSTQPEQGKAP